MSMSSSSLFLVCFGLLLLLAFPQASSAYSLYSNWTGNNFFNNFNFFSGPDPTHGYVYYANQQEAFQWGLVSATAQRIYIGADSWSNSTGSGRASVRISSLASFNSGLFAFDLDHMPAGCGTWPAYWLLGPNWPNSGEVDIIEGVNVNTFDQSTLHTSTGCEMSQESSSLFSGSWATCPNNGLCTNCFVNAPNQWANAGCGIVGPANSFGAPFNAQQGGMFVTEWTSTAIKMWFFPRGSIPSNLQQGGSPNPAYWPKPYAYFQIGSNCSPQHFDDLQIIINLTFCGDWAGSVFAQDCPGRGDCNAYVQNNPTAFREAYWSIRSLAIWQ